MGILNYAPRVQERTANAATSIVKTKEIVNYTRSQVFGAGNNDVLYTVPEGTVLYVTKFSSNTGTSDAVVTIKDSGTDLWNLLAYTGAIIPENFDVPLKFEHTVTVTCSSAQTYNMQFVGYLIYKSAGVYSTPPEDRTEF